MKFESAAPRPASVGALRHLRAGVFALALAGLGAAPLPALAADLAVQQVVLEEGDGTTVRIVLSGSSEGAAVSTFSMSEPDRLVIDIADTKASPDAVAGLVATGLVSAAKVETFDDGQGTISRVLLTLTGPVDHQISSDGTAVSVRLQARQGAAQDALTEALNGDSGESQAPAGAPVVELGEVLGARPPSGPCLSGSGCDEQALPSGPAVRSLDFTNVAGVSRIAVGTRGGLRPSTSQPRSDLIVVDFDGAFLPQSLGRVLKTDEFVSPVSLVRAYRTSSGARIAISLRRETTFTVQEAPGGAWYIDVAIPAGMKDELTVARQESSTAAPASSQSGISNAYQSELLIGSSGRTSDPQAAFGSGSGSTDPSALVGMSGGMNIDSTTATSMPYSGRKISLDLVNADIHSVFRLISNVSNLNIVAGDDVKGTITVRLQDVPWDQALAAVLQAKGLGSQRFGNILRVAPIETIKSERQAALEAKRADEELRELDMLVLPLNYATANELADQIKAVLSKRGSIEVDDRANQLIIKDDAQSLAAIRELVRHLDKQTPQVLIEARVVEANTSFTKALGIQWGGELDASSRTGYSTGLFFPNNVGMQGGLDLDGAEQFYNPGADSLLVDLGAESSRAAVAFNLGSIPGLVDLDARLSAMESDGSGQVISSPRVLTLDNSEAKVSQGQRIPFLSTSAGGTNVQFINASLDLTVTPHITSDGEIFLDISVSNNRADFSQLVQGNPAIQIKEIETSLLIDDGATTVIGGVFATEESGNVTRVPGLHKIPLLGLLFKNSTYAQSRNELLVFITPQVVEVVTGT